MHKRKIFALVDSELQQFKKMFGEGSIITLEPGQFDPTYMEMAEETRYIGRKDANIITNLCYTIFRRKMLQFEEYLYLFARPVGWLSYMASFNHLGVRPGQRWLQFSDWVVRERINEAFGKEFISQLLKQLPDDAVFLELDGRALHPMPVLDGGGCFIGQYGLCVASYQWEALEDGAMIPRLDINYRDIADKIEGYATKNNAGSPPPA